MTTVDVGANTCEPGEEQLRVVRAGLSHRLIGALDWPCIINDYTKT